MRLYGPGHMTISSAMQMLGKNYSKFFLWNQKANDLGTWYKT